MALGSTPSHTQKQTISSDNTKKRLLITILGFVGFIALVIFVSQAQIFGWDFRNNLWGPANLLVSGKSPYLIEQLFEMSNSVWLPPIIGATFPLGYLPQVTATNLWFALNVMAYGGLIYMAMPKQKPAPIWLGVVILLLTIFPSFIGHLSLGQISLVIAALLLWTARLLRAHNRLWLMALLITLAAAKPQLLILALPGIVIAILRQQGWRSVIKFAVYGIGWTALLTLPLWIAYPNWLDGFFIALGRNSRWAHPSSLHMLHSVVGTSLGSLAWGGLALGVFGGSMRMWWQRPTNKSNMIWSLALTILITPYVWSWDFVLLVPLIVWTIFASRSVWARIIMSIGTSAAVVAMMWIRINSSNDDTFYWWVPWVIVISAVIAWQFSNRTNVQPDPTDAV